MRRIDRVRWWFLALIRRQGGLILTVIEVRAWLVEENGIYTLHYLRYIPLSRPATRTNRIPFDSCLLGAALPSQAATWTKKSPGSGCGVGSRRLRVFDVPVVSGFSDCEQATGELQARSTSENNRRAPSTANVSCLACLHAISSMIEESTTPTLGLDEPMEKRAQMVGAHGGCCLKSKRG